MQLDAAILRAAFCRLVVCDRIVRASSLGSDARGIDPLADQIFPHRIGAGIGKLLVQLRGATVICVSHNLDLYILVIYERVCVPVEHVIRRVAR